MIRKATYFSRERDSLLQIVKKSTASTDSKGEDDEKRLRFYQFFLENPSAMSCKISKVEIIPKMASQRRYAVYCITVRTDVVEYQIKKRYTQFEKLYQRCLKHDKMNIAFPSRTIFQTGWCEEVTSFRMVQLYKFLEQISKFDTNQAFKIQLYDFINLYDQHQNYKVEGKDSEVQLLTDDFLLAQLVKLNDNPSNILDSFDKIKHSIADRKKRMGFQVARHLFLGFDEYSGLLSITLSNQNYLVVMGGLELVNWLISPQAHRDYEIFRRMLLKCLPNQLVIQRYQHLRSHSQLNAQYFKFIRQYLSARQDADIQIIAKFYDFGQSMEEQYERWVKFVTLDSRG